MDADGNTGVYTAEESRVRIEANRQRDDLREQQLALTHNQPVRSKKLLLATAKDEEVARTE